MYRDMLNVLVNAYAVSPNWGSEQGMGWNWVINLAKYCHLDVITEGEWQQEIESELIKLPQRENLTFHYLPVSDKVRKMCWNQGDWRFYWYYEKWQRRALEKAREICSQKRIDVLHQLNMIGFREPGYLWKIEDIPFVWGPIGGMELMPMAYLEGAPLKQRLFNKLKNYINRFQYTYSSRVRSAIDRASVLISAVKGVQDVLYDVYHRDSVLINETGVEIDNSLKRRESKLGQPLKIIWVGKFDFRKQLPLALRSVAAVGHKDIELHICGTGPEKTLSEMKELAESTGISTQCYWHGNVPHDRISKMMSESDLLFFTSIMEATSTVVLEAISVGLPVLCFNTCGFGPIVKEYAGITVELSNYNKSVQDFATALNKIYHNRNILANISKGILSFRELLTWDYKAKLLSSIYCQILKSDKSGCLNKD